MSHSVTDKYIIFNSIGSLEKDLAGTAVVRSIKIQYPHHKVVVVSNNIEVWIHNPDVFKVFKVGNIMYFYDDFIKDRESIIFWQDPYASDDFIQKRKHIIEVWCDLCKVQYKKTKPQVFPTFRELEVTRKLMGVEKPKKPIFLIQTHNQNFPNIPYLWNRDIPTKISQEVVDIMNSKGYQTFQLVFGNEPVLNNAKPLKFDIRKIFCAINLSDARFFINSFTQDIASALGKKSVVFYVADNPLTYGYPLNTNIIPKEDSDLGKYSKEWNEVFVRDIEKTNPPFPIENFYSSQEIADIISNI